MIRAIAIVLCSSLLLLLTPTGMLGDEATKADPKHYTVEFENDVVRVVRIKYGPGEKSVMHDHARYIVVNVTDGSVRFTNPDGTTEDDSNKAGDIAWSDAVTHLPENTGDQAMEAVLIEIK